jgi:hypothetical protein
VYTHIWSEKSSNLRSVGPRPLGYHPLMDRNDFRRELAQQLRYDEREGGLGDAVLDALASALCPVRKLAVDAMPGSGSPEELIHEAGIDAEAIATAVKEIQHEQQVA